MTTFHTLKVAKIEPETRDAVAITFAVPADLASEYQFVPGQHLTLRARVGGEELRRCYSICRPSAPGEIAVAVKAIEGGRFSRYAVADLQPGMALDVMVPQGQFGYQPRPENHGHYLAVAVGSGITPMLAIIATTLATESESFFTLIYGNRTSDSMMFRQGLADLKDRYGQRLQLVYLFSQQAQDSELLSGRPDGEKLRDLGRQLLDFPGFDRTFICGPHTMMEEARDTLTGLGVPAERIFMEHFATAGTPVRQRTSTQAVGRTVTLRQDGRDRLITLSAEDDSILDAALRQGSELPYACKGGVCATCKCRVLKGEVEMGLNYSLEPEQIAAGYVLSCQALPKGDGVVLDFDV
ncbi:phenylacetate-CoA oxygenase/reductase subunit PaaK [Shimwellia pseudoproteus]|uniref:1,2-phenylacetyl-CoA epoxidase subunit PaaE n=1 Tax=Shimwellia pseudoproteus TaxID=570012 RepID=UPI0018EAF120|nr:1,2-phenylacetyl-CoA epoxidase subunit PaaE [Shimwellia pseudoproteus]MBJ3813627.1 phenylacetate-CoA oxygenase/reductase subunit PaaK [Shimwellia pseudoproteus]